MTSCGPGAILLALLLFIANPVLGQESTQQQFEASIFGVSEISHFGIEAKRYSQLTAEQRGSLLEGKRILLSLFKAIQDRNGEPNQYLSDSLNQQFPTKQRFVQSLVDEETSLVAMLISSFNISKDGSEISFDYAVISSSEGMISSTERKATVRKTKRGWLISKI